MHNIKKKQHILIVEDQILIAKKIKKHLVNNGYPKVSIAMSFEGAIEILQSNIITLALLDVTIDGKKSGIDLAVYLKEKTNIAFIFLTSFNDEKTVKKLLSHKPITYINKPINKFTLISSIDFFITSLDNSPDEIINLKIGSKNYQINFNELLFVKTEGVYIHVQYKNHQQIIRSSLQNFLNLLQKNSLMQINRGTAVQLKYAEEVSSSNLIVKNQIFKISSKYKSMFQSYFSAS